MQGQLASIHQFCLTIGQQPPSNVYVHVQQQCISTGRRNLHKGGGQGSNGYGGGNGGNGFPQQPTIIGGSGAGVQPSTHPPTSYKHYKDQSYYHTNGSDVNNSHTSATCMNLGPTHNPNASRTNIMGRSIAGLACGHTPPSCRPQQQQLKQQCPPIAYHLIQGTTWQHTTPPTQFGGMQPAGGTYRQRTIMAMPVYQPGHTMMNFVD
jgi:hypothetical protein